MEDHMAVVQFPSGPRNGLTDREVQTVIAWCARERQLDVTPVPATFEKGTRSVSIFDSRGGLKWTVRRERGKLVVLDGDPDSDYWRDPIPKGTNRAADSLMEALTADD